jgi:hypothetical protein
MGMPHKGARGPGPSERLRWIADYLDLADKAIALIARVEDLDYPEELHREAQKDLRAWALWLDENPTLAIELELCATGLGAGETPPLAAAPPRGAS